MEGVGARFGRSSTRYGTPSTVFNGPVRKWKKKWIHVSPSPNNVSSNHHSLLTSSTHHNGNNGSHLLLYKWTPISQSQNNNTSSNGDTGSAADGVAATTKAASAVEELPRRKFKYIPIAVLEEQKYEAAEMFDYEAKPSGTNSNAAGQISENDGLDGKPDINHVPMEKSQVPNATPLTRQDLNESTLDLSLGLNVDSDEKTNQSKARQSQRVKSK